MKIAAIKKFSLPAWRQYVTLTNITLLIVIFLAAILRVREIGRESAWIDEAYSIVLSRLNLVEIIRGTTADQHPPLYYFLLHFWLAFNGEVATARLMSAVLGLISVFQVIYVGMLISKNKWMAISAGLLMAVAPINVWYSREVRMYTLLSMLTIAATTELWLGLHQQKIKHWLFYTLFCILAIYTHYFSSFILLAHAGIILGWSAWKRQRRSGIYWMGSMALLALAFLPWLPTAMNQVLYHTMDWLPDPTAQTIRDTLIRVALGVMPSFLPGGINWLILAALVMTVTGTGIVLWKREPDRLPGYAFLFLWAVLPVAAICAISLFYPIFQYKQFIIIIAPITLLIVWVAFLFRKTFLRVAFIGMIALAYLGVSLFQDSLLPKDDWRTTAGYLSSQSLPGDLVYSNPSASVLPLSLYVPEKAGLSYSGYPTDYSIITGGWYKGGVIKPGQEEALLTNALRGHRRVWLVEFAPQLWDPGQLLEKWLDSNALLLEDRQITRIRIRLYQLKD